MKDDSGREGRPQGAAAGRRPGTADGRSAAASGRPAAAGAADGRPGAAGAASGRPGAAGAVGGRTAGLRERKKQATRVALREAALRLALERGPENVRVEDIAEAAGVSPRTYNNYFSSREQAIVAAITAEREARVAAAVAEAPPEVPLADAVIDAVVTEYTDPGDRSRDALLLITTRPTLREAFVDTTAIEHPLTEAIATRLASHTDTPAKLTAAVLAASVAAAIRVALREGVRPVGAGGLVALSGSLSELLRDALAPLIPAFDAAEAPSPA